MIEGRKRGKMKIVFWKVLLLIVVALLVVGCGVSTGGTQTGSLESRERFSARRESEDEAIVAWSGYVEGYTPGSEEAFDITIKNETGQTWRGRYCLQLMDRQMPKVLATLEQRDFILDSGMGFSDTITVRLPEDLDEGAYGLSLPVRRPGAPMVDLVQIQIGETDEVREATTKQDMDAALEACPPMEGTDEGVEYLIGLAKADVVQWFGVEFTEIVVQSVEATEFSDASLGVPEPGMKYGQVITPGYVIELVVGGEIYLYHGTGDRVVFVPDAGEPAMGSITIKAVQVIAGDQIIVHGESTLPEGTCLSTELYADGELQTWWPTESCTPVQDGTWQLSVPLGEGLAPEALDSTVQYMLRAFLPGGPNIVSIFPFDIAGPPTSAP